MKNELDGDLRDSSPSKPKPPGKNPASPLQIASDCGEVSLLKGCREE
jgi:hypothetical protein